MRLFELKKKISFKKVIELFQQEEAEAIECGKERDTCEVTARSLNWFAARYGYKVSSVCGSFRVDKPSFDKLDFHEREILQMQKEGFDSNKKLDRISFAKKHNMLDDLKLIPHCWNVYNGQIIDFTAQSQFVDSGLAADTNVSRYSTNKSKSVF